MKKYLIAILAIFTLNAKNYGHRLGGELYKPENSLYSYSNLLKQYRKNKNFKYIEFDIQETKDRKIVLFHDTNNISRLIPNNTYNKDIIKSELKRDNFKHIKISDLTYNILSKLRLDNGAKIITLDKILSIMAKDNIKKVIRIEIKSLSTDKARNNLIKLAKDYSEKLNIVFTGFKAHIDNSFPYLYRWLIKLKKSGIKLLILDMNSYNITKSVKLTRKIYKYKEITRKDFSIDQKSNISFKFSITNKRNYNKLLIGIRHAYDDVGDNGLYFMIENNEKCIYKGFSDSRKWEWFYISKKKGNFNMKLIDKDTNGNSGSIKILGQYLDLNINNKDKN